MALDNEDQFGFPRWAYEKDFPGLKGFYDAIWKGHEYNEPRFAYDPIPHAKDLRLYGFFQSEKYFEKHSAVVRAALTPRVDTVPERLAGMVSVHVRRGDYLGLQEKHPIVPMEYYQRAMDFIRTKGAYKFLVFSDDLPWCRAQQWGPGVAVIEDMDSIPQLALTIACEHHIMANSTFSWWGSWLDPRPEKTVIAPAKWFGETHQEEFPTKDLFPARWIVI